MTWRFTRLARSDAVALLTRPPFWQNRDALRLSSFGSTWNSVGARSPGRLCAAALLALGLATLARCSLRANTDASGAGGSTAGSDGAGNQANRGGTTGVPGTDCTPAEEGQARCGDGLLEVCRSGRLELEADCGVEAQCSTARAVCLDCAPGSFRCSGDTLEQCNLEGSGFEVVETCATGGCAADARRGYCAICPVETAVCEEYALVFPTEVRQPGRAARPHASLRACRADGSGTESLAACDVQAPVCDSSALRCAACDAGAATCAGSRLMRCDADGARLDLVADCGHPSRCDAAAGECLPEGCPDGAGARLAVGSVRCRGTSQTELSICGASGLWEILDLCDGAAACSAGVEPRRCLDDAAGYCVPGLSRCVGNAVQRCADFAGDASPEVTGGTWYVYAHCTNQCVTSAPGVADCDDPPSGPPYSDVSACEPGSSTFLGCSSGSCVGGVCPSGQVCAGPSAGCQTCAPDKVRCDGGALKICNMTGTSESVLEDCASGACDVFRQKCLPVRPGERVCVDGDLRRVSADGSVQTIASCGAQALCDPAAGCLPPFCVVGSVSCEGDRVQRCADGVELTPTSTRCESEARCEDGLGCARAERVAAGDAHTCALVVADGAERDAGYVKCWGANESGQLGNGSSFFGDEPEARHVVQRGADGGLTAAPAFRASGLCAGRNFTCADVVLADGAPGVACWGANDEGQLGVGAGAAARANEIVAAVSAGDDVSPRDGVADPLAGLSGVTCGAEFACALDAGGAAWCWGANDAGQLGVQTSRPFAAAAQPVGGTRTFLSVFAGARHACALDRENALFCWGDGSKGQLGQPSPRLAAPLAPLREVTALGAALGRDFSLVLAVGEATLLGFGENFFGQLATGTDLPSILPIATLGLESDRVRAVFGGPTAAHGCALVGASLECWGANPLGQLGDGSRTDRYQPVVAIDGEDTALLGGLGSVALGKRHTCAIDAAGNVWCWGSNRRFELGASVTETASAVPVRAY